MSIFGTHSLLSRSEWHYKIFNVGTWWLEILFVSECKVSKADLLTKPASSTTIIKELEGE